MEQYFIEFNFESAGSNVTDDILILMLDSELGYTHITGDAGWLVGSIHTADTFDSIAGKLQDIIHTRNHGHMVEYQQVAEDALEKRNLI